MAEFFDGHEMSDFGAVDVDDIVDDIRADRER
jgi:hypothetical protein